MFFRRAIGTSLLVALLSGCSTETGFYLVSRLLPANEEPPSEEIELRLSDGVRGCLKGFDQKLTNYFEGNSSYQEITDLFDCHDRALELFSERTRGNYANGYSKENLKVFLEKYFLDGEKLSPEIVSETFYLKKAVFGGNRDSLTRVEIQAIRDFFSVLKVQMLSLLKHMPLESDSVLDFSRPELDQFTGDFEFALKAIGTAFPKTAGYYPSGRLEALLDAAIERFSKEEEQGFLREARKKIAVFYSLKGLFVSPSPSIFAADWSRLFKLGGSWFSVVFRGWHLQQNSQMILENRERSRLFGLAQEIYELMRDAVKQHDGVISLQNLDYAFDSLYPHFEVLHITELDIIKESLRPLMKKVLAGPTRGVFGRGTYGFSLGHLDRMWAAFQRWDRLQKRIERAFNELGAREDLGTVRFSSEELLSVTHVGRNSKNCADRTRGTQELDDLKTILCFPVLFAGKQRRVLFDRRLRGSGHSYHSISEVNWIWALFRVFVQGYGSEERRALEGVGLTQEEYSQIYDDFRRLGVDLRIFDPRFTDSAALRFREANLFSNHANGDLYMDVAEGVEFLIYSRSAKFLASDVHESIVGSCTIEDGVSEILDPFGKKQFTPGCFRGSFFSQSEDFFNFMPELKVYYREAVEKEKDKFEVNLEYSARRGGYAKEGDLISSLDIDSLATVLHYVESVFFRYDRNRDGFIDEKEAFEESDALSVFYRTLKKITPFKSAREIKAMLAFMLKYGKTPVDSKADAGAKLAQIWKFSGFAQKPEEWVFKADRGVVMNLFAEVKRRTAVSKEKR